MLTIATIAVALALVPAAAGGGQEERGFAAVPLAGYIGPAYLDGCPGVIDATLRWALPGVQSVRWHFRVEPSTRGKRFTLVPDSTLSDLDLVFFNGRRGRTWFQAGTGASGIVPRDASEGVVCLVFGPPTFFTYRAGA